MKGFRAKAVMVFALCILAIGLILGVGFAMRLQATMREVRSTEPPAVRSGDEAAAAQSGAHTPASGGWTLTREAEKRPRGAPLRTRLPGRGWSPAHPLGG